MKMKLIIWLIGLVVLIVSYSDEFLSEQVGQDICSDELGSSSVIFNSSYRGCVFDKEVQKEIVKQRRTNLEQWKEKEILNLDKTNSILMRTVHSVGIDKFQTPNFKLLPSMTLMSTEELEKFETGEYLSLLRVKFSRCTFNEFPYDSDSEFEPEEFHCYVSLDGNEYIVLHGDRFNGIGLKMLFYSSVTSVPLELFFEVQVKKTPYPKLEYHVIGFEISEKNIEDWFNFPIEIEKEKTKILNEEG